MFPDDHAELLEHDCLIKNFHLFEIVVCRQHFETPHYRVLLFLYSLARETFHLPVVTVGCWKKCLLTWLLRAVNAITHPPLEIGTWALFCRFILPLG
jgi:hypothetical protein